MDATQAESDYQVQEAKTQAAGDINQDFGENNIFPQANKEILKANKQFSPVKPPSEKLGKTPWVPPEVVGGLNQGLTPFYQEKIAPEQEKYTIGKNKFDADSANARSDADQDIANLNEEAKQKQLAEQKQAQQGVAQARQDWQTELDNVVQDYQGQAANAINEQRQKINAEKAKGEQEADQKLTEAEQQAEAEKKKADEAAAKEIEKGNGNGEHGVEKIQRSLLDSLGDALGDAADFVWKGIEFIAVLKQKSSPNKA
jgi:hypothetical protein